MILLDTSIAIWLLRGREDVARRARELPDLAISWVTHAELLVGAFYPGANTDLVRRVRGFVDCVRVLYPTAETCERYARLQAHLRQGRTRIPSNDAWIAALALERGLTIASAHEHFARVPELSAENWLTPS